MCNLFVYGTLMFDQVWDRIVKDKYKKSPAVLSGYARYTVKGETYPGLTAQTGERLEGVIIFDLTDDSLAILDSYEGYHYQRVQVDVSVNGCEIACETYVFSRHYLHLLSNEPWSPAHFKTRHLQRFLTTLA